MRVCVRLLAFLCIFDLCGSLVDGGGSAKERPVTYRHFRVTDEDGAVASVEPIAAEPQPLWARDVSQSSYDWSISPVPKQSYFEGPIPFVVPPPEESGEPFHAHNHQPDITWLPNGDLFAIWYSTTRESGTELTVLASRLRAGNMRWDPAYEFFKAENRNMHGNSIFHDGQGKLHHLNGMGPEGATGWGRLALLHRYSVDNGVTWSVARPVSSGANYQTRHQVIAGTRMTRGGILIQACDATPAGEGPTALHISRDGGRTWSDPGGDIRGIHAGVVELRDGRWMALGRGQAIDGYMPMSVSDDSGKTWRYSASPVPPIGSGQRLVLMRLREGPLLLVSFTSGDRKKPEAGHMAFPDRNGKAFIGHGMFAALSFDEGRTWPVRKLLAPHEGTYDGGAWTGEFTATPDRAEHAGYLAATQTPDGVIHLISSRLHYRFNLAWLRQPAERGLPGRTFINSVGMEMIRVEPGTFLMGSEEVYKEKPIHRVHITKPFHMAATQVTNAQYEQYDLGHKALRGKYGLSKENDEAVLFVSWHDAVGFCRWLSDQEGATYRLPTEAEWEYAARAGTTTRYNAGDTLPAEFHRNQQSGLGATPVPLHVGTTTPNAWGLHDMHGLVEEWVCDWYGPYTDGEKTDPVGRKDGAVKVTRGGSHGTPVEFLRSATRLGTLPEDRSWLIGFRVVRAEIPDTEPLPPEEPRKWARDIKQTPYQWAGKTAEPYFAKPQSFVKIPRGSAGPLYCRFADLDFRTNHVNHMPAVAWLDNGDLFAVWYSTTGTGRDMTTAASRFRAASEDWTEADVFFNAPGRNQTGSSLFTDRDGVLYWFNGLSAAQGHQVNNAMIMSKSVDHGKTWSRPILVNPDRNDPERVNLPMDNVNPDTTINEDGRIVIYSDNNSGRLRGGATVVTLIDLDEGKVEFSKGQIAGIHATAVRLKEGRVLAVGRTVGDTDLWDVNTLPMSVSLDGGNTWEYSDSVFPAIGHGQRPVLMRLQEGPLLLISFAGRGKSGDGMLFKDNNGREFRGYGMFGAISFDDGETWPVRKLITPADGETYDGQGATRDFSATHTQAEHRGYLTATQTPDGVIHLLSSGLHYRFNLAWLKEPHEGASPIQHVKVFYKDGRFGGWPANGGMWIWGDEILVAYTEADHQDRSGHAYDGSTARSMFARSLDGGETWSREDAYAQGITGEAHDHCVGERAKPAHPLTELIGFSDPDFAMLFHRQNVHNGASYFYYTYDRGKSWAGPFEFPRLDTHGLAARTDYIVGGPHEMLAFLTAAKSDGREGRIAAMRTNDGGLTWQRIAWIGEEPELGRNFAIMPSSIRLSSQRLLTVIRHRQANRTWLTSYLSEDNGHAWKRLGDPVSDNVNSPPALLRLPDGRIVLVYVFRRGSGDGSSVCARVSSDAGRSWSPEIVLREKEGANGDVGYPRIVRRLDGKLVITYYWNHAMRNDLPCYRYIAATIWDLGSSRF